MSLPHGHVQTDFERRPALMKHTSIKMNNENYMVAKRRCADFSTPVAIPSFSIFRFFSVASSLLCDDCCSFLSSTSQVYPRLAHILGLELDTNTFTLYKRKITEENMKWGKKEE